MQHNPAAAFAHKARIYRATDPADRGTVEAPDGAGARWNVVFIRWDRGGTSNVDPKTIRLASLRPEAFSA